MRICTFFFVLLKILVVVSFAQSETRNTQAGDRLKINLDADWLFFPGDINGEEETHQVNRRPWQNINLPHEWSIEGPYLPEHNTTQGFMPMEIGWYRKGLRFPVEYEDKKLFILFDGVYRESDVWMNYAHLGHHQSGYTSFYYDITDYVRTGNRIPNGLRVRVDAQRHEQDMYEGCGIYRHVWLIVTNKIHIDMWGTFVSTPEIGKKKATIKVQTKVLNETDSNKDVTLELQIFDAENNIVATAVSNAAVNGAGEHEFVQTTTVKMPHLWDIDDPYLYKAYVVVKSGDHIVDATETAFGIRSYYFDPDKGFFLNGKHVKLRGFNAHYDFAGLGTAIPDRIHWNHMMAMKKAGFNLFRSSHNPATPQRLDVCDQIGMLVWDEIERKLESAEIELPLVHDTIIRDRNHPSIILWSLENESPLESTVFGTNIIEQATALAHKLDPTRLTTFAASMPVNKNGYGDAVDVVSYNYYMQRAELDHMAFPHWKIGLISEYSASSSQRGIYGIESPLDVDGRNIYDLHGDLINPMYDACTKIEHYWQSIQDRDYLGGGCLWAGIDYWGEGTAWPLIGSGYGAIDMCLFPKDMYYYFVSQWGEEPMMHLFPHWTWPGMEGKLIDVWCYSNCDSVELFLNGRSQGISKKDSPPRPWRFDKDVVLPPSEIKGRRQHFSWPVKYESGVLKAVGMRDGKIVSTEEIHTAGEPAKIELAKVMTDYVAENQIPPLLADGQDIVVLKASILDKDGHLVPNAHNLVQFSVKGDEKIIGVGNGDNSSHEDNKAEQRRAFNGLCAVIVQATTTPGTFEIKAESPGLESGSIRVSSTMP